MKPTLFELVPRRRLQILLHVVAPAVMGCSSFEPVALEDISFRDRALRETQGEITVSVVALGDEEASMAFGVPLYDDGIQPVWIEISNGEDHPVFFLPANLDRDYFSPLEAAYMNHFTWRPETNRRMDAFFDDQALDLVVPPRTTVSGFVFANRKRGTRFVNVEIINEEDLQRFWFVVSVPGLEADWERVDTDTLYTIEEIQSVDEEGLRRAIEGFPPTTTNESGTGSGDPLNIVCIGDPDDIFAAFIRAGWDETETIHAASLWKTFTSFLFGSEYKYSPVSALYVFGRPQDIALQKARQTVHERNHLRLWRAPLEFEGGQVYVGQISRDIGVRFTTRAWNLTTHKIDPDVDETREYLLQDLLNTEGIAKFGYAAGVGKVERSEPRENLTGDPYYTDGVRLVLIFCHEPVSLSELATLDWEPLVVE